ncbi:MAG TPA: tRNA 2-selenouridine(34) synthase MnmH [Bacteroidales bacterium]|nr:tRNA 2-selenouridine(34) synthase MnmH [Bacteroidales bacterium]HPS17164.1 tRNA 2-selenouridine(34) synthase MnmH [Bacteroidales bacterium]
MISEINIEDYLKSFAEIPLIDVRSPSEFLKGHIQNANSIPLFSDEERAHVGTVFIKQSKEKAIKLGYEYVNPKLEYFISKSREVAPQNKAIVHCWRGGMRSMTFAEHLEKNGFSEVYVLKGGYKAFRKYVLDSFKRNARLCVIGGFTGSGKTEILKLLKEDGMQVIDLEKLANHKGSVFGGIDKGTQPTTEQFENNLFMEWNKMDFLKPICFEDESKSIGSVTIPFEIYKMLIEEPVVFLEIPKEERAKFLVKEYAGCNKTALAAAIQKISKRLGDMNTHKALDWLEKENFYEVALLALNYYDKSYKEVLLHRNPKMVHTIKLKNTDHCENARILKEFIEKEI